MKKILSILLTLMLTLSLFSCDLLDIVLDESGINDEIETNSNNKGDIEEAAIDEDGSYTSKEEVSLYIHTYGKLPKNFIKKKEAMALGWESSKGNLWDVTDQMSIGGDYFGNREKRLPEEKGRSYYECDIDYGGEYRGAKRIVYSNDGLIYYTGDHYETFNKLYGNE